VSRSKLRQWSDKPKGSACRAIFQLLRGIDPEVQCERKFDWLFVPRANERSELEKQVFSALREHCRQRKDRHPVKATCDPDALLADAKIKARARVLEVDFFLPSLNTAVEFDEKQHFTDERKISLQCYGSLPVGFSMKRWIGLCSPNIQDPDPPCRDWVRAFRDAVRDIRAAQHGIKLVRIYYRDFGKSECAAPGAGDRLRQIICSV
jgi:hypothetical protein